MSPTEVFLKTVEKIRKSAQQGTGTDPDTILIDLGTPFEQILLILWACHHVPNDVLNPHMKVLQNPETIE